MPEVKLPFTEDVKADKHDDSFFECSLYRTLANPLQEACNREHHLLQYLHVVPPQDIGTLQYYEKLSRKLQGLKPLNVIYPLGDDLFAHVYSGNGEERAAYVSIEPSLFHDVQPIMMELERRLLDYTQDFARAETDEERKQLFLSCIDKICTTDGKPNNGKSRSNGKVHVEPHQFQAIKYLLIRDKVGLGILEPLLHDPNIEDISCSGVGHIFLEHKMFRSLQSAVAFSDFDELDEFILRLAERIGKPVTLRNPVVDAVLPDGSRVNIVYGREVSKRGSNFTIRKFSETPLSILELIEFGSLDYMMAAYLSIVLEDGMNCFVIGETASGKTTLLNAITTFIPPTAKVVSIEDTPELQVPQKNWLREVAKPTKTDGREAQITMFDLLKAALRQRPNVIIVGEIRGEEGATAFQAMQTGHAVMATFHAASVEKLIQRITGNPINVPKTYMDNLNVVVIQSAVKLPDGKMGRRAVSINEIVSYDPISNAFSFIEIFRWNSVTDKFEFVGNRNSYILEQKIAPKRGLSNASKWKIYELLARRARILEKLQKEMGIKDFYELLQVMAKAQQQGIF